MLLVTELLIFVPLLERPHNKPGGTEDWQDRGV